MRSRTVEAITTDGHSRAASAIAELLVTSNLMSTSRFLLGLK